MNLNIKKKIRIFNIISTVLTLFFSVSAIIVSMLLYGMIEFNLSQLNAFLYNFIILSIPAYLMILICLLIFKKDYKFKYILIKLLGPLIIAIYEHLIFIKMFS